MAVFLLQKRGGNISRIDRCVVRNQAYRGGEFSIRERHNERKNESYGNGDIVRSRSPLNVHFKACNGTYKQSFDRMVEDGTISLRGLGKDPKVFDELVFDVNTSYFDRNGGYEFAKEFFAVAYQLAVKEVGGEEYIFSAVMHADERNKAESERLGRDVFHYHLHVVYVPVVEKEIYYRKNNKNPELAGKLKEVITQVSHSKKWPRQVQVDENGEILRNSKGKAILVNSYSLLQDHFHEHMKAARYTDFERGERGSTRQHLTDLEYKTQQEARRAAELADKADFLSVVVKDKTQQAEKLDKKLTAKKAAFHTFSDIEAMARQKAFGKVELTAENWRDVSELAKKGVVADANLKDLKGKLAIANKNAEIYKKRWETVSEDTKEYRTAQELAPTRTKTALAEIISQGREPSARVLPAKEKVRDTER